MKRLEFVKLSGLSRGVLFDLLTDAYSSHPTYLQDREPEWRAFDDFFFDHLPDADNWCFVTVLDGEAIGFVSWDPRKQPDSTQIGHNCIATRYNGKGYGKRQLQEAVSRIGLRAKTILVTTDDELVPAQRMYASVGFRLVRRWEKEGIGHLDYAKEIR